VNESDRVPLADCSLEEWDHVIDANLRGTFLCSKYAIPEMIHNPSGGAIVNISSIGGVLAIQGRPAYCASKGGIIALTRQAALDYAKHRIRVNAIAPGAVETGQWRRRQQALPDPEAARHEALEKHPVCRGFGRMIQPEDVAQAALFLASDEAVMITGTVLLVDGGRSLL
jgi:NAD(P)-dependent dehydrogenase (short-subunit alcohol dehydrogenase family)